MQLFQLASKFIRLFGFRRAKIYSSVIKELCRSHKGVIQEP